MIFKAPDWVPSLPEVPDSIPISDFIFDEKHGRRVPSDSRDPYICGLSGKSYSVAELQERFEKLSRALAHELKWQVNVGSEYDKVAAIFCLNTIDLMVLAWSIHRLNGVCAPANATFSASELATQLLDSGAKCIFTCMPLLSTALEAAIKANIPKERIFLCPQSDDAKSSFRTKASLGLESLDDLILKGTALPNLENLKWSRGQGRTQTAFLCYSSGTSGLPKGVQISHYNVISNVLQICLYEQVWRRDYNNNATEIVIGALPFSHIYGLVIICHTSTYRGDQVVVLPRFDFHGYLNAISRFKVSGLFVVPPIVITMVKNMDICRLYNLDSVRFVYNGAAPLGDEVAEGLRRAYPNWTISQAYGLTEATPVVTSMSRTDIWPGSSGSLLPGIEAKIMSLDGKEIESHNISGEMWVKGPNVVQGYLHNQRATEDTFIIDNKGDRWLKTGDEVEFRVCPTSGAEHLWVVDRIKELIKVKVNKGHQVAPAELEATLLSHPAVADCAVIGLPDDESGEVPKAYIVKNEMEEGKRSNEVLERDITQFVQQQKMRYKWIRAIEFIDVIPKSASGKILRRQLRDMERKNRKKERGTKL